jgi:hypothetical protein
MPKLLRAKKTGQVPNQTLAEGEGGKEMRPADYRAEDSCSLCHHFNTSPSDRMNRGSYYENPQFLASADRLTGSAASPCFSGWLYGIGVLFLIIIF